MTHEWVKNTQYATLNMEPCSEEASHLTISYIFVRDSCHGAEVLSQLANWDDYNMLLSWGSALLLITIRAIMNMYGLCSGCECASHVHARTHTDTHTHTSWPAELQLKLLAEVASDVFTAPPDFFPELRREKARGAKPVSKQITFTYSRYSESKLCVSN